MQDIEEFVEFLPFRNEEGKHSYSSGMEARLSPDKSLTFASTCRPTIVGSLTCDLVSDESILHESVRIYYVSWIQLKDILIRNIQKLILPM